MSEVTLSAFARNLSAETAFDVLAVAKRLKGHGTVWLHGGATSSTSTSPTAKRSS